MVLLLNGPYPHPTPTLLAPHSCLLAISERLGFRLDHGILVPLVPVTSWPVGFLCWNGSSLRASLGGGWDEQMPTSVLLGIANVPFPVVFQSVLPHLLPSYAPSSLSGQIVALDDLCPGFRGSHSISWAESEPLYLQPRIPGAFYTISTSDIDIRCVPGDHLCLRGLWLCL